MLLIYAAWCCLVLLGAAWCCLVLLGAAWCSFLGRWTIYTPYTFLFLSCCVALHNPQDSKHCVLYGYYSILLLLLYIYTNFTHIHTHMHISLSLSLFGRGGGGCFLSMEKNLHQIDQSSSPPPPPIQNQTHPSIHPSIQQKSRLGGGVTRGVRIRVSAYYIDSNQDY